MVSGVQSTRFPLNAEAGPDGKAKIQVTGLEEQVHHVEERKLRVQECAGAMPAIPRMTSGLKEGPRKEEQHPYLSLPFNEIDTHTTSDAGQKESLFFLHFLFLFSQEEKSYSFLFLLDLLISSYLF